MVEPRKHPRRTEESPHSNEPSVPSPPDGTEQFVFTLNGVTREVIKVEKRAAGGQYLAISDEEWASLANEDEVDTMMTAAQDAFAAGLIEGLKQTPDDEPAEDFALLQLLIDEGEEVRLLDPELRLALERRLLLRRLLRGRLLRSSSDLPPGRRPITHKASNGSATRV